MQPLCTDDEQYKIIRKKLKKDLERKRYVHTKGVAASAVCLAMAYGYDMKKAYLAGLLHDNAKSIPTDEKKKLCKKYRIELNSAEEKNPELIHAKLGAYRAKDVYQIDDEDILSAIACHTTGKPEMNTLDKIIYIADYIEPGRYKAQHLDKIRALAFRDLDECMYKILADTLAYLEENPKDIDNATKDAFLYYKDLHIKRQS